MNVYDFDGTIYHGDSTVDFFFYALKKDITIVRFIPKQALGFLRYGLKQIDKTRLKEYFFSFLSGINTADLVESFWDAHQYRIYEWYLAQQAIDDVVISASPEFLLKPICCRLGILHLIASDVDPLSGRFLGENCRGQEKRRRWNSEFPSAVIDNFYSDSLSDLPMAQLSSRAFLIKDGKPSYWGLL